MKKLIALLFLTTLIVSCAGPSAGLIPQGREKTPDISSKYVEQGAFFSSKEKLDYEQFANKKCQTNGRTGYKAYKYSGGMSGMYLGVPPFAIPFTDVSRTANIWCK